MVKNLLFFTLAFLYTICTTSGLEYRGKKLNITKEMYYLKDLNNNIKDIDILKGKYDSKFIHIKEKTLNFTENECNTYLKVQIKNSSYKSNVVLYAWIGPLNIKKTGLEVLNLRNNKIIGERFITKVDEDSSIHTQLGYNKLNIKSGEVKDVYIKFGKANLYTPIFLTSLDDVLQEEKSYRVATIIILGMNITLTIFIILIYITLKKRYFLDYLMVVMLTYLKSNVFMKILRLKIPEFYTGKFYSLFFCLYIIFLIDFVNGILKLKNRSYDLYTKLDFMKYIAICVSIICFTGMINQPNAVILYRFTYLLIFSMILYLSYERQNDTWLSKNFFWNWIIQYLFLVYFMFLTTRLSKYITLSVRFHEISEAFANVFLLSIILAYDAKELWRARNKNEDANNLIDIMTNNETFKQAFIALFSFYKRDIRADRIMFFRRETDTDFQDFLYYDFSIPSMLDESGEERKYFDLTRKLNKDEFDTYYVCNDVENNEIYSSLLRKRYKSYIAIRLAKLDYSDLGYIVILSKDKTVFEYDEAKKSLRYEASLLVQYFNTVSATRTFQDKAVLEDILKKTHIEVIENLEKDMIKVVRAIEELNIVSNNIIEGVDIRSKNLINHFFEELKNKSKHMLDSLNYNNHIAGITSKYHFQYILIEELLNTFKDSIRRGTNTVIVEITSEIATYRPLFGVIHSVRSIINYLINYIYDKVISAEKSTVKIHSSEEEDKIRIKVIIEDIILDSTTFKKQYNNVVQRTELGLLNGKLYLKSSPKGLEIMYVLDIIPPQEEPIELKDYQLQEKSQEIFEDLTTEEVEFEDQEILDYYENNPNYKEKKED